MLLSHYIECRKLRESAKYEVMRMWKCFLKGTLKLIYRMKFRLASLEEALGTGEKVMLCPHHVSFMDPVLFALFVPGEPLLVVSPALAATRWFALFKGCVEHVVMDLSDPFALKELDELWKKRRFVILFPEEEPTTNGILAKLSEAVVTTADRSGALVVPARAMGMQYSRFSRTAGRLPRLFAPQVTLVSGRARRVESDAKDFRERRRLATLAMEGIMKDFMMETIWDREPLFDTLVNRRRLLGGRFVLAIEPDGTTLDLNGFFTRLFVMESILRKRSNPGERVGIMLPNTSATLALVLAAQHGGREPCMINYSMGARLIVAACAVAKVGKIVTSARFVEEGKFASLVESLQGEGLEILYLEELVGSLSALEKIRCLLSSRLAARTPEPKRAAEKIAVVLFTSGSEGTPKAVALTHLNIQANIAQARTVLDFFMSDVMVHIMPMFHSFGLCIGAFMSFSACMTIAFYPTPLHYKKIPRYSRIAKGTVLLGTNAFLYNYAKSGDPLDFSEMRYVVCGGDKLKENTARLWSEKFGIRILEGYGVTEASPVVGVNTMGHYRFGSVGRLLPGMACRLGPIEGVTGAGRLIVDGPNIMKGYLRADGSVQSPGPDGYDTGDIVTMDDDGFIFIRGRAKRFAKIGGEMVSLTHIEEVVQEIWPDSLHAVVGLSDESRGEIVALLTERESPDREELRRMMIAKGLPELALPKKILHVPSLPKIGVGKTDYQAAAKIAAEA